MTLTSLTSLLAAAVLTTDLAVLVSDFLIVTEAFDCTESDFTSDSDKFFFVGAATDFAAVARTTGGAVLAGAGLAVGFTAFAAVLATLVTAAVTTFVTALGAALVTTLATSLAGDLAALVFLDVAVSADVLLAGFEADVAFVEGVEVFAVFFIAFAIESTAKRELHSLRQLHDAHLQLAP